MTYYVSTDNRERTNTEHLMRIIRAIAEGSLLAMGFAVAILLVGTPIALGAVLLQGAVAELMMAPFTVAVAVIGSVAALGAGLVFFFRWRQGTRARIGVADWKAAGSHGVMDADERRGMTAGGLRELQEGSERRPGVTNRECQACETAQALPNRAVGVLGRDTAAERIRRVHRRTVEQRRYRPRRTGQHGGSVRRASSPRCGNHREVGRLRASRSERHGRTAH